MFVPSAVIPPSGFGFHDVAALESDKDLEPLREDASYKRIIEDLKKKS